MAQFCRSIALGSSSTAAHRRIDEKASRQAMAAYRLVPPTTMLTLRLPHCEQTSRLLQSGTVVSAPYRSAISVGSGSTWWRQSLHQTINRKCAAAECELAHTMDDSPWAKLLCGR
jgi:hypothetical protein